MRFRSSMQHAISSEANLSHLASSTPPPHRKINCQSQWTARCPIIGRSGPPLGSDLHQKSAWATSQPYASSACCARPNASVTSGKWSCRGPILYSQRLTYRCPETEIPDYYELLEISPQATQRRFIVSTGLWRLGIILTLWERGIWEKVQPTNDGLQDSLGSY